MPKKELINIASGAAAAMEHRWGVAAGDVEAEPSAGEDNLVVSAVDSPGAAGGSPGVEREGTPGAAVRADVEVQAAELSSG